MLDFAAPRESAPPAKCIIRLRMANTAQARKRARQVPARRARSMALASRYRTHVKAVLKAVAGGDRGQAAAAFRRAMAVIDSAATRGLIHRNKAARQKSRLNARVRGL